MLSPGNADLALLAARLEIARGQLEEAIALLRRSVMLDSTHLQARFALAEEMERAGTEAGDAEATALLDELQQLAPSNLAILLERARVAAKRGDAERLRDSVARLEEPSRGWPPQATEQYDLLLRAISAGNYTDAARGTALLRNVLARVPAYTRDLTAVRTPAEVVAQPFEDFLALAKPPSSPAPPDGSLTFSAERLEAISASAVVAFSPNGTDPPTLFAADSTTVRRLDEPGATWPVPGNAGQPADSTAVTLLPIDWNNDFRTDLFVAAVGGVRLLVQNDAGRFEDATLTASGGAGVACGCLGAWAADVEMDGDLDIVLGVLDAATLVLRNNGDGTWATSSTFAETRGVSAFAWADLDHDGDPDAVLLERGRLRVFRNERAGAFRETTAPEQLQRGVRAMTVADVDSDGTFDVVALTDRSVLVRAWLRSPLEWTERELVQASIAVEPSRGRTQPLLAADLDNNGAIDLVYGRTVWLSNERHELRPLEASLPADAAAIVDLDADGRLDVIGVAAAPVRATSRGSSAYHWKQVRVRAQAVAGDQRINSFGIGGEIEVRSGLLRQKQLLAGGPAHFGLGTMKAIDVARIVWPNGVPQAEFAIGVDDAIVAEQRLKGSCPWVFAFDGREMRFVTDFLWRSPLGLRINAQDVAESQTEDWVRIGGHQLAPRNGQYDVRITAELWETHFFDHVSLMAIDHPADVETYIDERFSPRPEPFAVRTLRDFRAVTRARDVSGRDVTDLVARQDGRFLAAFSLGRYQGIASDHFVEFEIAHRPSAGDTLMLVARGWVYPTDSSINVAIAQGRHVQPRGLSLEAQRTTGEWVVVNPELGFPAGKNKTMLIDLSKAAGARRLRLRTNLEVSWDSLASAVVATADVRTTWLHVAEAELRYRGFSRTTSPRGDAPETPVYQPIASTGQRWRDLDGYYTRFGDVGELLTGVDDRYVIMNAGDELSLRFPALPAPPNGWRRDFVLVGDGWEKDGDFNTEFSATVLPLPAHGRRPYDPSSPPTTLEDDPVYRRHRADWERYHTRYVSPAWFARGLGVR
jgi:hypothetical protein